MAELSPNLGLNLPVGSDRFDYDKFLRQNFQILDDKVGKSTIEVLTATEGQTVFTLSNPYALGTDSLSVEVDGVKQLIGSGYTETSTTSITLSEPLVAGAKVKVVILGLDQGQDNRFDQIESSLAESATDIGSLKNVADYIDVRNYGVTTDGSDCTQALQNAINDAIIKKVPIKFPSGAFGIYSTINITKHNLCFIGTHSSPYSNNGVNGTTLIYYGTGSMFEIGSDDGIAFDNASDYNGFQGTRFEHIRMISGRLDGTLSRGGKYSTNSTAIKDWRGGSLSLKDVYIAGFEFGFWAVKSDYNYFSNVYLDSNKVGLYLDSRCDQNTFIHLSTSNNDRAIEINQASHTRFISCQFVVDGSSTINPIKIYSTYSSGTFGTLFEGCWFERYVGGMLEAFVEIGVGDTNPSGDITFRDCSIRTGVQNSTGYAKYFCKIGTARRVNFEDFANGNNNDVNNLSKLFYFAGSYSAETFAKLHHDMANRSLFDADAGNNSSVSIHSYGAGQMSFYAPNGRFAFRRSPINTLRDFRLSSDFDKVFAVEFYNAGDGNTTRFLIDRRFKTGSAAPTTLAWDVGDYIQNNNPSVQGTAGSQYIIRGWACVTAGTPGTWVQDRGYTGT